jgi:hypothetical protein
VFFRSNTDTRKLFRMYEENKGSPARQTRDDEDGGCSESCEVYETVVEDLFGNRA